MKDAEVERHAKRLAKGLRPMVEQIVVLKKTMKAAGMFTDDRELLKCPSCGLQEDVAFGGRLIVTKKGNRKRDTGLRFKELDQKNEWFACPSCRRKLKAPDLFEQAGDHARSSPACGVEISSAPGEGSERSEGRRDRGHSN